MAELHHIEAVLLGTGVGDALGLPYENMARRRVTCWTPGPVEHRFVFGKGVFSDDTEHAYMVGRSLARTTSVDAFEDALRSDLRGWFFGIPVGIGLGTLRALVRLTLGFTPTGVASAGNGPAMRAPLLGVIVPPCQLRAFVDASTRITHTDPRAADAAYVVAFAARRLTTNPGLAPERLLEQAADELGDTELAGHLRQASRAASQQLSPSAFAAVLGLDAGVSGFCEHTVPTALFAACTADDFRDAVESSIRLGGDTDTVAAIAGAIAALRFGVDAIPNRWLDDIADWPLTVGRLRSLARALHAGTEPPPPLPSFTAAVRSVCLVGPVAVLHVLRRAFPPYGWAGPR